MFGVFFEFQKPAKLPLNTCLNSPKNNGEQLWYSLASTTWICGDDWWRNHHMVQWRRDGSKDGRITFGGNYMMSWQKLQRFDDKIEHKNKNFNVNILSYTRIYKLANRHNFMLSFMCTWHVHVCIMCPTCLTVTWIHVRSRISITYCLLVNM